MSEQQPLIVQLHEMKPGDAGDFFVLLAEKKRGATREGKPFYSCRFRDAHRAVSVMIWSDSDWFEECEHHWKEGEFYKIRGVYQEHRTFGPQVDVRELRAANDEDKTQHFDPFEYVESSRFHPDEMFAELCSLATEQISDEPLRQLVLTILERYEDQWKRYPATQRHFFPFQGGLLEHTLSVTRSCVVLANKYIDHYPDLNPPINKDLLVAGAILHDCGRLLEFEDDTFYFEKTVPGHLFGHLFLARDIIKEVAAEHGNVDPELLQLLEHVVISHLNHPKWGSPRLPLLPECLILHHLDDLDAKVEMYARCLMNDEEDGLVTARDPVLGKQLLKRRKR